MWVINTFTKQKGFASLVAETSYIIEYEDGSYEMLPNIDHFIFI